MKHPPIITLLTDFGTQDYFVGAMKGVVLSINPDAQIVDITHDLPPHDIHAGAFNLLSAYRDFPAGTIHVGVVDPGVGSERRAILIECAEQFFVGPDNGLFSWITQREGKYRVRQLQNEKFFRERVSATFHGRDVFAPVAAHLSQGTPPEECGPELEKVVSLDRLEPEITADHIEGRIIHLDRFGNCVTNLTPQHLGAGATLTVNQRRVTAFREFFAQTKPQPAEELFMIVGSAGFVEIVAQNASAAAILNARRGDRVTLAITPESRAAG